jgi:Holliday junction DNA helicase RuvA
MYAFISGRVVFASEGQVVIENNGIGYQIMVSNATLAVSNIIGETKQLHTYFYVKEDIFALYGFATIEEKNMFLKLIAISGVGPKLALQVLSGIEPRQLALCIVTNDLKTLSKIKGIGKKTAERIVLELREGIADEEILVTDSSISVINDDVVSDAVLALQSLGISKNEAYKAVIKAREKSSMLEEIITLALRGL